MTEIEVRAIYEAISEGRISRIEAGRRLGHELSFGDMLMKLRDYDLPLPRFKTNPDSPGVRLIKELASRGSRVG